MKKTSVTLKFPSQFSQFIDFQKSIEFQGENISELIDHLDMNYGDIRERLLEEDGQVKPYINLFLESRNITSLEGLNTIVPNGGIISLLLSRAGG